MQEKKINEKISIDSAIRAYIETLNIGKLVRFQCSSQATTIPDKGVWTLDLSICFLVNSCFNSYLAPPITRYSFYITNW